MFIYDLIYNFWQPTEIACLEVLVEHKFKLRWNSILN